MLFRELRQDDFPVLDDHLGRLRADSKPQTIHESPLLGGFSPLLNCSIVQLGLTTETQSHRELYLQSLCLCG